MREERIGRLAWPIAWFSIALVVLAIGMSVFALSSGEAIPETRLHQIFSPIFAVTYGLIGGIVAARRPRNPVGWISAAAGVFYALALAATSYGMLSQSLTGDSSLAGTNLALWVEQWAWFPPAVLPMTFLLLLFPDGRPPSRRWRPIVWASAAGLIAATLVMAVVAAQNPGVRLGMEDIDATLSKGALDFLTFTVAPLLAIGVIGSIAAPIARFRRSRGIERQQLKWMAYAGGVLIVGVVVGSALTNGMPDNQLATELGIILTSVVQMGIVLAAGVAILKYRLYDIDILINRTLVYGALSILVVALYVVTVAALGAAFRARGDLGISLFATGLVAVGFQPLRNRLQRGVNRLMYGERDEPYQALSRLSQRLEGTLAPSEVLSTIVETIAQTLKLPYVAIALAVTDEFEIAAEYGEPVEQPLELPLTYQAEAIGRLVCGPRGPGEPFQPSERMLLEDMAHQAGVAVHAVRLTSELQRSRQRLVTAREEERRRLRRDLHDGLGPELAALNLKLEAARNLIDSDPKAADSMLAELKTQVQEAIADIRRLVYELRPPALDELGLVPAVRETAATHNVAGGLQIQVEGPDAMPPLPAAVEVAAYRIAQEALHNVTRHAEADRCLVRFSLDDVLELEVLDDGVGFPEPLRAGVGLTSMKERVSELGGVFALEPAAEGGARLRARLPLLDEEA
jgi:signal transduction histidine kinase